MGNHHLLSFTIMYYHGVGKGYVGYYVCKMKKHRIPKHLWSLRGGFKGHFVIKHYKGGVIVMTKFPDMSGIIASAQQRRCRDLFARAVVYAKSVIADPELKKAWQKKIRRRNGVYNKAIKAFMLKEKNILQRDVYLEMQKLRLAFKNAAMIKKGGRENEAKVELRNRVAEGCVYLETG